MQRHVPGRPAGSRSAEGRPEGVALTPPDRAGLRYGVGRGLVSIAALQKYFFAIAKKNLDLSEFVWSSSSTRKPLRGRSSTRGRLLRSPRASGAFGRPSVSPSSRCRSSLIPARPQACTCPFSGEKGQGDGSGENACDRSRSIVEEVSRQTK